MSVFLQHDFDDPVFAVAFHPTANHYVVGSATGQVSAYTYNVETAELTTDWTTKRHKASCRGVAYDQNGKHVYTVGSDLVVKKARLETGKVTAKELGALNASPTTIKINETFLLVGDERANLTVFDVRTLEKTHEFKNLHQDIMTSIVDWPFKNKYHFVTSGATTLAHVDIRKGVLKTSEDQEDEILSGCLASDGFSAFGMSEGVVTIWDNRHLDDQMTRIRLSDDSVDCLIAGEEDNEVYAGGADGIVRKLDVESKKITNNWVHGKKDEVAMLELDFDYRLVSVSMDKLKLWNEEDSDSEDEDEEEKEDEKEDEEEDQRKRKKRSRKPAPADQYGHHGVSKFDDL